MFVSPRVSTELPLGWVLLLSVGVDSAVDSGLDDCAAELMPASSSPVIADELVTRTVRVARRRATTMTDTTAANKTAMVVEAVAVSAAKVDMLGAVEVAVVLPRTGEEGGGGGGSA